MSISTVYVVSHTLPDSLTNFLSGNHIAERHFENAISEAQKGNCGAGSNAYSDREEWAEFNDYATAKKCDDNMRRIVSQFHTKAINAAPQS